MYLCVKSYTLTSSARWVSSPVSSLPIILPADAKISISIYLRSVGKHPNHPHIGPFSLLDALGHPRTLSLPCKT